MEALKTFIATFPGVYIGGSAVVISSNIRTAKRKLQKRLAKEKNLTVELDLIDMYEFDTTKPDVIIIDDGDY